MKIATVCATTILALQALAPGVLCQQPLKNVQHESYSVMNSPSGSIENEVGQRHLASISLSPITEAFKPVLVSAMKTALAGTADPLSLGLAKTFSESYDYVTNGGSCTVDTDLKLSINELSGLSGFVLDNLELANQQVKASSSGGWDWSVDLTLDVSFPQALEVAADVEFSSLRQCQDTTPITASGSGTIASTGASLQFVVSAEGTYSLSSSSSATISVTSVSDVDFGTLSTDIVLYTAGGTPIVLDLTQPIGDILENPDLLGLLEGLIAQVLNDTLNYNIDF